jgi:hypothetical protein
METAKEVQGQSLPEDASLPALWRMRKEQCGESKDFHLQSFQIFLRRILSPESPNRNMLLFHGVGTGKTCSAIQVAEEYILRPEFQNKKVIVLAGRAVQGSFRTQIFDVTRAEEGGSQCTGRRYLDMLQRAQKERLRWEDAEGRDTLTKTLNSIIDDFYAFEAYASFAGRVQKIQIHEGAAGIQKEFDNRLIIVDEAHNLRSGDETSKLVSSQLETILKTAKGITLVLLTATPMFDTFDEILYYLNLFLWNDRRQEPTSRLKVDDFFTKEGEFVSSDARAKFQGYVHEYVSFIRGENPFTFPFRLPPPPDMVAPIDRQTDPRGNAIKTPRMKLFPLVGSIVQSPQKEIVELAIGSSKNDMIHTLVVSPIPGRKLSECFVAGSNPQRFQLQYAPGVSAFLAPSVLPKHAAKFATVIDCIKQGKGVCFVYSNFVKYGTDMFAAALEEAGFEPYTGARILENTSKEVVSGSAGKYTTLTETNIDKVLMVLRSKRNVDGSAIKVIIGSPFVSEGVDFRYVRQVHILDPWDNLARIEQIIGRGLRTCSHSALLEDEQNCTVYLHICRLPDSTQECLDEYVYRERVLKKATTIGKIKRILEESAIDCSLQLSTNQLPQKWKDLLVPQRRSQDGKMVSDIPLSGMISPSFDTSKEPFACMPDIKSPEPYIRPLSSYLDIADEVYDTFVRLFKEKPVWSRKELIAHPEMVVDPSVVQFLLQTAQENVLRIKDAKGREGTLESKGEMIAFKPFDSAENATMVERLIPAADAIKPLEPLVEETVVPPSDEEPSKEGDPLEALRTSTIWKFGLGDFPAPVLNWYLADTMLAKDEKHKMMKSMPRTGELAPFMKDLVIPGVNFLVLGKDTILNTDGDVITPVGAEKDAFTTWMNGHIDRIANAVKVEDRIVSTMGDTKAGRTVLKFAAFSEDGGKIKREKREKTIKAKECAFFTVKELDTFARELHEGGLPAGSDKKDDKCMILGIFVRDAVLKGNPLVLWIPPELMEILSEEPYKTTLRSKLK